MSQNTNNLGFSSEGESPNHPPSDDQHSTSEEAWADVQPPSEAESQSDDEVESEYEYISGGETDDEETGASFQDLGDGSSSPKPDAIESLSDSSQAEQATNSTSIDQDTGLSQQNATENQSSQASYEPEEGDDRASSVIYDFGAEETASEAYTSLPLTLEQCSRFKLPMPSQPTAEELLELKVLKREAFRVSSRVGELMVEEEEKKENLDEELAADRQAIEFCEGISEEYAEEDLLVMQILEADRLSKQKELGIELPPISPLPRVINQRDAGRTVGIEKRKLPTVGEHQSTSHKAALLPVSKTDGPRTSHKVAPVTASQTAGASWAPSTSQGMFQYANHEAAPFAPLRMVFTAPTKSSLPEAPWEDDFDQAPGRGDVDGVPQDSSRSGTPTNLVAPGGDHASLYQQLAELQGDPFGDAFLAEWDAELSKLLEKRLEETDEKH